MKDESRSSSSDPHTHDDDFDLIEPNDVESIN